MTGTLARRRFTGVLLTAVLLFAVITVPASAELTQTTTRASVTTEGGQSDFHSGDPMVSANGRYVAFESDAQNLTPGHTNGNSDIFVYDLKSGAITCASVSSSEVLALSDSYNAAISADGRYVVFESYASDLVPGIRNGHPDIYMRDLVAGETTRVTVSVTGLNDDSRAEAPAISADGRYVAFSTYGENLIVDDDNGRRDIYVRDMQSSEITRVSVSSTGEQADSHSSAPSISADGRFVAFYSNATNLVPDDTNFSDDIFVHDMESGETTRASVSSAGVQGNLDSHDAAISADGSCVAFSSWSSNLVPGDTDTNVDVFVRNLVSGYTTRVSVTPSGADGSNDAIEPSLSATGRYVAFSSNSTNLVAGDVNDRSDVFVRDMVNGVTALVSLSASGEQGTTTEWTDESNTPSISADGLTVAFQSLCDNLVANDTNGTRDIFVRRWVKDPAAPLGLTRVSGTNRYKTGVEASKLAFPDGARTVVIATGANWPDALGGSALAGAAGGPLLLTATAALPAEVSAEIARLGATNAYILGGPTAVGPGVEAALKASLGTGNVTRLAGDNRYETARKVADEAIVLANLGDGYDGVAYVATGSNFPDALAVSPIAAAKIRPVLLADPRSGAVSRPNSVTSAYILGSTSAVPASVQTALGNAIGAGNVHRLFGDNRYETAAAIANHGVAEGLSWDGVGIVTGTNFPDGLSGGAMLARFGSVMLLTPGTSLAPAAKTALEANAASIDSVFILGGDSAVSDAVAAAARNAAGL